MEDLLELAFDDPEEARVRSLQILVDDGDPLSRSYARQALGIVLRGEGRLDEALAELRIGMRDAARAGVESRESDVRATYGATLAAGGRTRAGLRQLDRASAGAKGMVAATVEMGMCIRAGSVPRPLS